MTSLDRKPQPAPAPPVGERPRDRWLILRAPRRLARRWLVAAAIGSLAASAALIWAAGWLPLGGPHAPGRMLPATAFGRVAPEWFTHQWIAHVSVLVWLGAVPVCLMVLGYWHLARRGRRRTAAPWWGAAGYWLFCGAAALLVFAACAPGNMAIRVLPTDPTPAVTYLAAPASNLALVGWLGAVALAATAATLAAVDLLATGGRLRAAALPSALQLVAGPFTATTATLLAADLWLEMHQFAPRLLVLSDAMPASGGGQPLVWQAVAPLLILPGVLVAAAAIVAGLFSMATRRLRGNGTRRSSAGVDDSPKTPGRTADGTPRRMPRGRPLLGKRLRVATLLLAAAAVAIAVWAIHVAGLRVRTPGLPGAEHAGLSVAAAGGLVLGLLVAGIAAVVLQWTQKPAVRRGAVAAIALGAAFVVGSAAVQWLRGAREGAFHFAPSIFHDDADLAYASALRLKVEARRDELHHRRAVAGRLSEAEAEQADLLEQLLAGAIRPTERFATHCDDLRLALSALRQLAWHVHPDARLDPPGGDVPAIDGASAGLAGRYPELRLPRVVRGGAAAAAAHAVLLAGLAALACVGLVAIAAAAWSGTPRKRQIRFRATAWYWQLVAVVGLALTLLLFV